MRASPDQLVEASILKRLGKAAKRGWEGLKRLVGRKGKKDSPKRLKPRQKPPKRLQGRKGRKRTIVAEDPGKWADVILEDTDNAPLLLRRCLETVLTKKKSQIRGATPRKQFEGAVAI